MASALLIAKEDELYRERTDPSRLSSFSSKCKVCKQLVEIEVNSCEISDQLMYIDDLTGSEYNNAHFIGANISLPVCCDNCQTSFPENVFVTGYPLWNDEEIENGSPAKLESFVGCEVVRVSDRVDTSLQECFKCDDVE